jgi:hypothetical protein
VDRGVRKHPDLGLSLYFPVIMRHFVDLEIGNGRRLRRIKVLPRLRNHDLLLKLILRWLLVDS